MKKGLIAVFATAGSIGAALIVAMPHADSIATTFRSQHDWQMIANDCPNQFIQSQLFERLIEKRSKQNPPPDDLIVTYRLYARAAYRSGDMEKTARILRQGLPYCRQPSDIEGLTELLGWLLVKQGKIAEAKKAYYDGYKRMSALGCEYFGSELMQQFYIAQKDAEKEREFQIGRLTHRTYQSAQSHRWILIELAELEAMENRPQQCLDWLAKITPDREDRVWMLRAWCEDRLGHEKLAEDDCKKAIATFAGYECENYSSVDGVRLYYASFLRSKGRVQEAQRLEEQVRRDGHEVIVKPDANKFEAATGLRAELEERSQRNPFDQIFDTSPPPRADLLGGLRFLYGQVIDGEDGIEQSYSRARDDYERAAALDNLCSFYCRQKKADQAYETLNRLFTLTQNSPKLKQLSNPYFFVTAVPATIDVLLSKNAVDDAVKLAHKYADSFNQSIGKENCMRGFVLSYMAEHFLHYGKYSHAEALAQTALSVEKDRLKRKIACGFPQATTYKCLAVSEVHLGQLREAKATYQLLLPQIAKDGYTGSLVQDLNEYAQLCKMLGDDKEASRSRKRIDEIKQVSKSRHEKLFESQELAYQPVISELTQN